ncbi:MAG TPA: tetratricopeptide repeat protein [Bryobacteraceae bacterium]|jgi:Flp pilus assembly protein TadD|nr:tetratricopeptide repeat protein [Bryobacteraceae bacterium]
MSSSLRLLLAAAFLVFGLLAAYSNHFGNSFHFDDFHTIQDNVHVRSLTNVARFFSDPTTFSNLPTHRVYRPILTTTLAVDYASGKGQTLPFHITSFALFLALLAVTFAIYVHAMRSASQGQPIGPVALFATAVYAFHPVCAETLNYIVQRGEILSTLGVAAGLALWAVQPQLRRFGLYLVPVVLGLLSKPPALVFPVLLFAWLMLIERRSAADSLRASAPSLAVCGVVGWLLSSMTSATFNAGGPSASLYRITQPWVVSYYFSAFFAPIHLNADTDWRVLPGITDPRALAGFGFVSSTLVAIFWTARRAAWRPVSFGLAWFLIALFPTCFMPLAEVANDHRMFFPFVGLTLAVVWAIRQVPLRVPKPAVACAALAVLATEAYGTWQRNEVWRNEETLWHDVIVKSPTNGRGLMNYALTQMSQGRIREALTYLERARTYNPSYFILEINLGVAKAALGSDAEAQAHFLRALELEPGRYEPHFYYARYLHSRNRTREAQQHLEAAVRANPDTQDVRQLLLEVQSALQAKEPEHNEVSAENYVALSLAHYRAGRFEDCVHAAQKAIKLRPNYAEAWNNVAAGYNALHRWQDGIRAADEALRLKPDFELARNNRAWAISQQSARATQQ